jgi:hypothetical protein
LLWWFHGRSKIYLGSVCQFLNPFPYFV